MLQSQKQNFHNSKLPKLGQTGHLLKGYSWLNDPVYLKGQKSKVQVIAFPLCDNEEPYSLGIHTAIYKDLANGQTYKASGFFFEPEY